MGYSHYWYRPQTLGPRSKFAEFVGACARACADFGPPIAGPRGEGYAEFSPEGVRFNGRAEDDDECETFSIRPEHQTDIRDADGRLFDCCKTREKPYDLAVRVCMLLAKHHWPEIVLNSDAEDAQPWEQAARICLAATGIDTAAEIDFS